MLSKEDTRDSRESASDLLPALLYVNRLQNNIGSTRWKNRAPEMKKLQRNEEDHYNADSPNAYIEKISQWFAGTQWSFRSFSAVQNILINY